MQPDIAPPQSNQPVTPQSEYTSAPVTPSVTPPPAPRKTHRGLWEVLVVLLIVGAAIGGYFYGHNKTSAPAKTAVTTTPKATQSEPTVHFVQSVGYPFDLGAKTIITTKLGVPATMQAVRASSNASDPGLTDLFTDKTNDEVARFSLGTPEDPNDNGGGTSSLSILAVSKSWLAATNKSGQDTSLTNYIDDSPLQTPAQKQKFVSDLKASTTACVTDQAKGFVTKDKTFNICYTLNPGKEAYSPSVIFKGYAEIEKQPMILAGMISIYDPTAYTDQAAEQKVITDAKAGTLPAKTKTALDALLSALAQTTVTASPNPLKQ